jgi:hypothetical protein
LAVDQGGGCSPGRLRRLKDYLAARDRGEVVPGRILQVLGAGEVRVALGPGVLTARAVGGRPEIGECRLEIMVPGPRPILRLLVPGRRGGVEVLVDASWEKRAAAAGDRLDRRV